MPRPFKEYPAGSPKEDSTSSMACQQVFMPASRRRITYWRDADPGRRRPMASCSWRLHSLCHIVLIIASLQLALSASHHSAGSLSLANPGIPTQTGTSVSAGSEASSLPHPLSSSRRFLQGSSTGTDGTPKDHLAGITCPQNVTAWGRPLQLGDSELPSFKWTPAPGKTLMLLCDQGQMSNRMICVHNHIIAASLLNRTLIVPKRFRKPGDIGGFYSLANVWDIEHTTACLGDNVIMTAEEYTARFSIRPKLDLLACWYGPPNACPFSDKVGYRMCPGRTSAGTRGKRQPPKGKKQRRPMAVDVARFREDALEAHATTFAMAACLSRHVGVQDFLDAYAPLQEFDSIAMGDLVLARFVDSPALWDWGREPFAFAPQCQVPLTVFPPRGIQDQAQKVVSALFGNEPFMALHLRRGDFLTYCRQSRELDYIKNMCYYPIEQIACSSVRAAKTLGLKQLFLATNGHPGEVEKFTMAVERMSKGTLAVRTFPKVSGREQWVEKLNIPSSELQLDVVSITLQKFICALSDVFQGYVASTFTNDIRRLRYGMRTSSCHDSTICGGEVEWNKTVWRESYENCLKSA